MFGKKKMHSITEAEALAVAARLHHLLLPGALQEAERYLNETMDRLELAGWQRHNLSKVYDIIASDESSMTERIAFMKDFLGGDERAAACFCAIDNMRTVANALAVSAAEDINNLNEHRLPIHYARRRAEKQDALDGIAAEALHSLMDFGGMDLQTAQLHLRDYKQAMMKELRELSGKAEGRGR